MTNLSVLALRISKLGDIKMHFLANMYVLKYIRFPSYIMPIVKYNYTFSHMTHAIMFFDLLVYCGANIIAIVAHLAAALCTYGRDL